MNDTRLKNPGNRAFSVVEILAVVAIMAILMALATPAFLSVTKSFTLTMAGQDIRNAIALARQEATSKNRPVEVRFCRPGSDQFSPVRYLQLVAHETNGTLRILSRPIKLPEGVYVDTESKFDPVHPLSPLFLHPNSAQGASSAGFSDNQNSLLTLPDVGSTYQVFSFFILSDGTSTLPWNASSYPSVTLRNDAFDPGNPSVPRNYATVQIDPVNCRTTLLRP